MDSFPKTNILFNVGLRKLCKWQFFKFIITYIRANTHSTVCIVHFINALHLLLLLLTVAFYGEIIINYWIRVRSILLNYNMCFHLRIELHYFIAHLVT